MFKLRRYLRGHYLECILAPAFKGLEAILQLFVPLIMAQVIDVGIAHHDASYVLLHGAALVALGLFCYVVSVIAQYLSSRLAASWGTALRNDLYQHIMSLSRQDIEALGRSSLVTRLINDSQQAQDGLNMFFRLILRTPFVLVGTVVSAHLVDGFEGATLMVAIILSVIVVLSIMRVTTRLYRRVQARLDHVQLKTAENLEGVRVLRAFCREDDEKSTFSQAAVRVRNLQTKSANIASLVNPLTYTLVNCGLVVILWVGGIRINAGSLSQGQLVALVSYVTQALVELLKLTNLITMLARAQACAGRINEVFAVTPSLEDGTDQAKLTPNAPVLELHDVSFAYPGAAGKALSHIDLTAQAGEVIGVIGGTGSGKSTLASLIMRFYDATEGSVCVGGKDVRTIERKSLRRSVGLVEQNPSLFSGTIASNLRWGNQKASEEDLMEAVATAQASDVINSRVEKLDATVEQFGRNFSGGQRQRLAIARTVVRRPAILILDDAASALDFATDAALRRSIAHDLHDTCTIIISQRVSAVRSADKIMVLDGGCVVGMGTHDELKRTCDVYREICESQLVDEEGSR